jgi:glycosyltransferase involved in cell wall biosynthesis
MLTGSVPDFVRRSLFALENILIRRADLLITVGEKLRRHFDERGARRSVVVGNWKRPGDFARGEEQNAGTRRKLAIPAGALTVVCITQLLRDRQLEELLDAVDANPDVYAIIGGGGVLEPMVRERAGLNPRIKYTGFVGARQIADLTCAADIVYYGFDPANPNARFSAPNKLYEALAAGRPLITGDFGEIAEVVRASGCGIVLPRYTAVEVGKALAVLADPAVRGPMALRALQCGRTSLNWEKGEQVLHAEYSALIGGLRRPPAVSAVAVARS